MIKKTKGSIIWIDDEVVGYKCECGEVVVVGIYEDDADACPKCGRRYVLQQINIVCEIVKDG